VILLKDQFRLSIPSYSTTFLALLTASEERTYSGVIRRSD
jgi:hypothetical protein